MATIHRRPRCTPKNGNRPSPTCVAQRGRLSVNELAAEYAVTTETVRRDLSVLERAGVLRRVHGGAVPAASLTVIESRVGERDRAHADEKDRIAKAAAGPAPRGRRQRAARRRARRPPAGRHAPPRPQADRGHQRGADRGPARRARPASTCSCCPAGSARRRRPPSATTPSRRCPRCGPTSRSSAPTASPPDHGLTTPDADEAAAKRAMVARCAHGWSCSPTPRRSASRPPGPVRGPGDIDVLVTDDGIEDADRGRSRTPASRW